MTRPLYEPSTQRQIASQGYADRQLLRRPGVKPGSGLAIYEIKVFEDQTLVEVLDDAFVWEIPEDLDGAQVVKVEAFISTAGGDVLTVQIRHSDPCDVGANILTTPITIDAGDCNSKDAAVQPVISGGVFDVAWGDHLHCDVDDDGDGAMGLGLIVTLAQAPLGSVVLEGAEGPQGPPGGIVVWTGEWDAGTTYDPDDAVSHNGSSYVAINTNTNVEPGVDAGWETDWMLLASGAAGVHTSYAYIRDEKAAGTDGGTFSSGAWRTRTLNTEVFDPDGIVSLSSDQFTLAAGTYWITARAPAYHPNAHKVRIRDMTNSATVGVGSSARSMTSDEDQTDSWVHCRVVAAGTTTYELQHRCSGGISTFGFGVACNFDEVEVYAEVWIWLES